MLMTKTTWWVLVFVVAWFAKSNINHEKKGEVINIYTSIKTKKLYSEKAKADTVDTLTWKENSPFLRP